MAQKGPKKIDKNPVEHYFGIVFLIALGLITAAWLNALKWAVLLVIVAGIVYWFFWYFYLRITEPDPAVESYLKFLRSMDDLSFKQYVFDVLRSQGFVGSMVPHSEDLTVHMWLHKDGKNYAIRTEQRTLRMHVREKYVKRFYNHLRPYKDTTVVVITSGQFTNQAKSWAQAKKKHLKLISGRDFARIAAGVESF